jgi:hypothetical protein
MSRLLLLFIDGIGLGDADPAINPFAAATLPTLTSLLAGRRIIAEAAPYHGAHASLIPIDATLGIAGLPQSGTGQTALLTGENAPKLFGRHFGPWVPTALRELLGKRNVLTRAAQAGRSVAFANAYPEEVFTSKVHGRGPLRAGPPIAALGAGVLNRHTSELMRGDAVASEIINEGWRKHLNRTELPVISAGRAGANLARIAAQHELTMFAHYSTDAVGHTGEMDAGIAALERVDEMFAGLLNEGIADLTIAVVSDHGNLEDVRVGHTLNPAVGLFIGPARAQLTRDVNSLMDVTPRVLELTNAQ